LNTAGLFTAADGTTYRDKKRYFWLMSLLIPLIILSGPMLYMVFEQELFLWLAFIIFYGAFPVLDHVMGQDSSNPPEAVIGLLEADPYYHRVAMSHVPIVVGSFIFCAWFVANNQLSWPGYVAVAIISGNIGGHGINIGHELGHKKSTLDKWLAKIVLAPAAYGYFSIEHNRGHHKHVATPNDPASAKMGETIYQFALREIPGGFLRAHTIERDRLKKADKSYFTIDNQLFQSVVVSVVLFLSIIVWLGSSVIVYLLISALWSIWQLTSANYIEHYGLQRLKLPNGRYERVAPHHSWNSNHIFSNWALFHLQRHSDHHANASRSYQSLRHFPDLPTLPNGYFGMYILAYIPTLWFKVMNPKLVEVTDANVEKINMVESKRARLIAKYHLH